MADVRTSRHTASNILAFYTSTALHHISIHDRSPVLFLNSLVQGMEAVSKQAAKQGLQNNQERLTLGTLPSSIISFLWVSCFSPLENTLKVMAMWDD